MATETKNVTREVTFKLTETEIVERAKKAADLRLARAAIQVEFARVKSSYKGRIEEKENELSAILEIISEGKEKRVVNVTDVYDFGDGVVETFHVSSNDPIESRVMSNEERQQGLPLKPRAAQGELSLTEPSASPTALTNESREDVEPWRVDLPAPLTEGQELYVAGEADRPTIVRHLAATWRIEAGEARTFVARTQEVFGSPTLCWISSDPVTAAEKPAEEPAPADDATPA